MFFAGLSPEAFAGKLRDDLDALASVGYQVESSRVDRDHAQKAGRAAVDWAEQRLKNTALLVHDLRRQLDEARQSVDVALFDVSRQLSNYDIARLQNLAAHLQAGGLDVLNAAIASGDRRGEA